MADCIHCGDNKIELVLLRYLSKVGCGANIGICSSMLL